MITRAATRPARGARLIGLRRASATSTELVLFSTVLVALLPLGYFIEGGGVDGFLTQGLYGAAWVLLAWHFAKSGVRVVRADLLWVAWLLVMLAVPIVHQSSELTQQALRFAVVGVGTVLFCRAFAPNREAIERLLHRLMFLGGGVGLVIVVDYIRAGAPVGLRYNYQDVHPVPLAMLGATVALLAFVFYSYGRLRAPTFVALGGVGLALLVISASKGPLVSMLGAMLLLMPVTIKRLGVIRVGVVAGLASLALRTEQVDLITQRLLELQADPSTGERLVSYDVALEAWRNNVIIGSGLDGGGYPHNLLLEVLANHGLLLGLVLLAVLLVVARRYARAIRAAPVDLATASTYGLLLMSLMSVMVSWTYLDHKFLFIGLGLALSLHVDERMRAGRPPTRLTL